MAAKEERKEKKALELRKKFLRLLKENNAVRAYIDNFNNEETIRYRGTWFGTNVKNVNNFLSKDNIELFTRLSTSYGRDLFINYSFIWEETPEGQNFWDNINFLWNKRVYGCGERKKRNHMTYKL